MRSAPSLQIKRPYLRRLSEFPLSRSDPDRVNHSVRYGLSACEMSEGGRFPNGPSGSGSPEPGPLSVAEAPYGYEMPSGSFTLAQFPFEYVERLREMRPARATA